MRQWALDQRYIWRLVSVIAAWCLMQIPLPYALQGWQPQWVLMVCLFWLWVHPSRFSFFWIVLVGFITDYLSGLPLGVHAVGLVVVAGLMIWKHYQWMHSDRLHQFIFSIILFLCYFMMMRFSFELCHLKWSWVMMLKTQITTCVLWAACIWKLNFHTFWFNYVD
jgi:rod shape-determining protein MreD